MARRQKTRLCIVFGGRSGEHEVSLTSAASVISALSPEEFEITVIGITKEGKLANSSELRGMLPPQLFKRVQLRKEKEMFENIDELINVRKKALKLATNWNIIDTDRSIGHTAAHIEDMLQKLDKKQ